MRRHIEPVERRVLMAVTATYSPAMLRLTVSGDALGNTITVSRNAAGGILVNGGAVAVAGGTPTVANTSLIVVNGLDGDDTITLDETNGALPASILDGGNHNDALTGGSGPDAIHGGAGNDTMLGKGGFDTLLGGLGNDVLTGGDADDQVFGEGGDDRMIWNPGDDTDLNEGGDATDTVEVNGGGGAEQFTTAANGSRVRFDRLDPAPFAIDIGTSEAVVLNCNAGNDSFSATGNLAALIDIVVNGGAGDDMLLGSNGDDVLLGGDNNDFIDGQLGSDTAFMGAGNDTFQWDPGDASDVVEGQDGTDTMLFNGSGGAEQFTASANGGRVIFTRDLSTTLMDLNDVEALTVQALGGADRVTVNDLAGTDVTAINVRLASTIGGATGDAAADVVVVHGTNGADVIDVMGSGTSASVVGLPALVQITTTEAANDTLVVNGLGGADAIIASALPAGIVKLTADGGAGNDSITGSLGNDIILGGAENDLLTPFRGDDIGFLGAGNDTFVWNPGDGSDIVEGQADVDTLQFNGAPVNEMIDISANGGRLRFFRDVASITMDCDDVETVNFAALAGADTVVGNDLTGTDVITVNVNLEETPGGATGDGEADSVVLNFGAAGNAPIVIDNPASTRVAGWGSAAVVVSHADAAFDSLRLNTGAGNDTTTITQTGSPGAVRRVLVDGGADQDTLSVDFTASDGAVVAVPNPGNEVVHVNIDNVGIANVLFEATQRLATLNIGSGGLARLTAGGEKVLVSSFVNLSGTARLDLTDNNMVVDYTGVSPMPTFRGRLLSGFNGGAWTGTGIFSSAAQAQPNTGIGYAEATDLFTVFPATFKGVSVDSTALLFAHTLYGDANLDNAVNLQDFNRLAASFGQANRRWSQGDFDYNGAANLLDFNRLAGNFGRTIAAAGTSHPATSIKDDVLA